MKLIRIDQRRMHSEIRDVCMMHCMGPYRRTVTYPPNQESRAAQTSHGAHVDMAILAFVAANEYVCEVLMRQGKEIPFHFAKWQSLLNIASIVAVLVNDISTQAPKCS